MARQVLGAYQPMTAELIQGCITRNAELLHQEQVRRTNAEAKNGLESFIIDTRDKLSDMETVSTDGVRNYVCQEHVHAGYDEHDNVNTHVHVQDAVHAADIV